MTSGKDSEDYSVFGLRVRSELALPELFALDESGAPDVAINRGRVDAAEAKPGINADEDGLVLIVPEVARFRISGGNCIIVDAASDVPDRNVRLFLLGSAFGALLHQRGMLPLHANAIEINGAAVAFMGPSGAGKSTLAAWFYDRGHRVIADDVCVVGLDVKGNPYAAPGLPRLRLWREALELMGRETTGYHRSYVDTAERFDKFDIPVADCVTRNGNLPLAAVYLLSRSDSFSVKRIDGVEAADAIFANTYRGSFVYAAGTQRDHWMTSIELVRRVPVFVASREWSLAKLNDQCCKVLEAVVTSFDAATADAENAP